MARCVTLCVRACVCVRACMCVCVCVCVCASELCLARVHIILYISMLSALLHAHTHTHSYMLLGEAIACIIIPFMQ